MVNKKLIGSGKLNYDRYNRKGVLEMLPQPKWLELFKQKLSRQVKPIKLSPPLLLFNKWSLVGQNQSINQTDSRYSFINWQINDPSYGLDRFLYTLNEDTELVIDNQELAKQQASYHVALLSGVADYIKHDFFNKIDYPAKDPLNWQHIKQHQIFNVDFAKAIPELQCLVLITDQGDCFAALPFYNPLNALAHCPQIDLKVTTLQNYLQQFNLTRINNLYLIHLQNVNNYGVLTNSLLNSVLNTPETKIYPHLRNGFVDQNFAVIQMIWREISDMHQQIVEYYLATNLKIKITAKAIKFKLLGANQELQEFLAAFNDLNMSTINQYQNLFSFNLLENNKANKQVNNWALISLLNSMNYKIVLLWLETDLSTNFNAIKQQTIVLKPRKTIKPLVKNKGLNQMFNTLQENSEHQYYFKDNYLKTLYNDHNQQVKTAALKLWRKD